jgi:hypothetical protein
LIGHVFSFLFDLLFPLLGTQQFCSARGLIGSGSERWD